MDRSEDGLAVAAPPSRAVAAVDLPSLSRDEGDTAVRPIGQLLIEAGLIGDTDVARALAFQERFGGRFGSILVRLGAVSEERLLPVLSVALDLPLLSENDLPSDMASYLTAISQSEYPIDWWIDQEALPWYVNGELWVVAKDPLMSDLQEFVLASFGNTVVRWALISTQVLDRAIDRVQQGNTAAGRTMSDEVSHLRELAEEAPVIELVSNLIGQAFAEGASDIHVEPEGPKNPCLIRLRIDTSWPRDDGDDGD